MNDKEILEKAITKAIAGGWFKTQGYNGYTVWTPVSAYDTLIILEERESHEKHQYNYQAVIFNHDFAKALWGEEEPPLIMRAEGNIYKKTPWQYHLQRMVIADNPLEYLEEHI